jgi:hypothetical protein
MEKRMPGSYVYWLVAEPTEIHLRKKALIEERGYKVVIFQTLNELLKELAVQRAGYYIVGDEGPEETVIKTINVMATHPEIQGAKLVLSASQCSPNVLKRAAGDGFRDILALDIHDREWIQRFLFSIAGKPMDLPPTVGVKPLNENAHFFIPARISLMSEERFLLESRFSPEVGSIQQLHGGIADALGVDSLPIVIEQKVTTNLRYRFSEGVFATWADRSLLQTPLGRDLLARIRSFDSFFRPKIFLAIQSPALRSSLLRYLDVQRFEVHTALQKRSMIEDPKFFAPHIVFIEERLCINENLSRYAMMVAALPKDSTVVVVGSDNAESALQGLSSGRKIVFLKRIPVNLRELIEREYLPRNVVRTDACGCYNVPYDHEFSIGEICTDCHILGVHATMFQVGFPFQVGRYSLGRVGSRKIESIVGHKPYVKLLRMDESSLIRISSDEKYIGDRYIGECYFCDVSETQRRQLIDLL